MALKQGTQEWLDYRRTVVSGTDIPVLLGLSPYRCEADLADEKLGGPSQESTIRMRIGSALQGLIGEEYERQTGRRVTQFHKMHRHPTIEWAAASLDFRVIGERRIVEAKQTSSRSRFADGIPQDVEAQVAWQLGVTGYPVADIAVLTSDDLTVYEQRADPALFADLVAVAEDFRRRLAEGGPFARDAERIKRDYPADDGTYLEPTPDLVGLVDQFREAKEAKRLAEDSEKTIGNALRTILGPASGIEGLLTYRKSADSVRVNWPAVAKAYRELLDPYRDDEDLDAIESIHSETATGPRVLRLSKGEKND